MSKKYLLKEKKKSIPAPVLKNMLASAKKNIERCFYCIRKKYLIF